MTGLDRVLTALHDRLGLCGHCGRSLCPEKSSHSVLPDRLPLELTLAAIASAFESEADHD